MSETPKGTSQGKPNRLIHETSPYLLQHAYNPVDWYPWTDEALRRAREEDKPILISVGYSACHWCHVMAHESFEDPEAAALMNEHFINIKVDREERPDLDQIYQLACQLLTRQGGWPLNVFLLPDGRPFYAGTYFPPEDRHGRPSWTRVLKSLAKTWAEDREKVLKAAEQLTQALGDIHRAGDLSETVPESDLILEAVEQLKRAFDRQNGGFGTQPKFPNTANLHLLLRQAHKGHAECLDMVEHTLEKMAAGGIYDQLGGGFHRYSTDARWLVPHFEKMLYDNALLCLVYLEAYQQTGKPLFARIVRETLAYVEREMTHPEGGFYSTQDADSEGEEGKFFVWTGPEIAEVLGGPEMSLVSDYYGVTPHGNFEGGTTVLHVAVPVDVLAKRYGMPVPGVEGLLDEARQQLWAARERRVKPGLDDKVIAGWNGMMISAFARAAQVLAEPRYAEVAKRAVEYVLRNLSSERGDLIRSFRKRAGRAPGYLEDYAYFIAGLIDLYEATFTPRYLQEALRLAERAVALFWDEADGGFFETPVGLADLIHRPKSIHDHSVPAAASVMTMQLLRLAPVAEGTPAEVDGARRTFLDLAEHMFRLYAAEMEHNPWGAATLLAALDTYLTGTTEIVLVAGDKSGTSALAQVVYDRYLPGRLVYRVDRDGRAPVESAPSLFAGKTAQDGRATAYVCRNFACSAPVTEPDQLGELLK